MDESLSDKNLLLLYDQYGGTGIVIDGQTYKRGDGLTPLQFIQAVRETHSEWKAEQAAQKARAKRDAELSAAASESRESHRPTGPRPDAAPDVQKPQESLEEFATRQKDYWVSKQSAAAVRYAEAETELEECAARLRDIERVLEVLNASQVRGEIGSNLPGKVEGRQKRRKGVGTANSPKGVRVPDQRDDAEDV